MRLHDAGRIAVRSLPLSEVFTCCMGVSLGPTQTSFQGTLLPWERPRPWPSDAVTWRSLEGLAVGVKKCLSIASGTLQVAEFISA